jgi:cation diffusion facilitator family transporter
METFAAVRFVLVFTLFLNMLVTVAKIGVGYLTGSLSILADGFDSLFDGVTNVIGLIAIYLARRPADEDHPYGHRRYETLMTLAVAALLFITCYGILQSAYQRLRNPATPDVNVWSFASLFLSIAVHFFTARYEIRRGRELKSEFLLADASHTSADILVTIGVIVGLIVVRAGYAWIDALVAVAVALIIAKIGVDIIRSSARVLTDAAAIATDEVAAIVQGVPGVQSFHRIRSRGQQDDVHLDLHIRVAPDLPLAQAHSVGHQVQRRIMESIEGVQDVIVHVEPQSGAPHTPHGDLLQRVREIADSLDVSVHHLNAHEIAGQYSVDLHVEVPNAWTLGEAHARADLLEDRIKAQLPEVIEVHTHMEPTVVTPERLDSTLDDARRVEVVRELAREVRGVRDCHEVSLRRMGDRLFLNLRCSTDEQMPIAAAHDIATLVEDRVHRAYPDVAGVSVHIEPVGAGASS